MDEMTLLRQTRDAVAPVDAGVLAEARARLMVRAASDHRPRRTTRVALTGAAGAAAAGAVVVAGVGLWPGSTPPASAADLLHQAAGAAGEDVEPGPGQYLAVETHEVAMEYVDGGKGRGADVVGGILHRTVNVDYVPHDRADRWVARSWSEPPSAVFAPHARIPAGFGAPTVATYAKKDYAEADHADDPRVDRALAGAFGNGELGGDGPQPDRSRSTIATLSRDPHTLLQHLRDLAMAAPGASVAGRDEDVLGQIAGLLRTGEVPGDLRSAMYDALALVPGIVITEHQTTLDGRTGTAIGVRSRGDLDSVVIDPETGDYLGERQLQTVDVGPVPAGTVIDQTSVRVSVVDRVPG